MDKKLPVYRLTVTDKEDENEIFTALVDAPAIESNFVAFNNEDFGGPGSGPQGGKSKDQLSHEEIKKIHESTASELGLSNSDYSIQLKATKGGFSGQVGFLPPDEFGRQYMGGQIIVNPNAKDIDKVIRHEMRHIYQSKNKGFYVKPDGIYWEDKIHVTIKEYKKIFNEAAKGNVSRYNSLPWELDAINFENSIQEFASKDKKTIDLIELPDNLSSDENITGLRNQTQFSVADSDRRIITGAVMIPDMQIYRKDGNGEYYVYFTKEDIELFARKWAKGNRYNAVNEMHDRNKQPSGMYLLESFISDSQRGINAPAALKDNFPEGTWFQSFYVESDELWAKVKSGEYKGFSMEMMVDYIFSKQDKPTDDFSELISILNNF